jgi:hypothetical protein
MPLTEKTGTRESKALRGREAAAASSRVAYSGFSMRVGHGIVGAVAHGMRAICYGVASVSTKIHGKVAPSTGRPHTVS